MKLVGKGNEFTCAGCGGTYVSNSSEQVAREEASDNGFAEIPDDEMAVICDDCYIAMGFVLKPVLN